MPPAPPVASAAPPRLSVLGGFALTVDGEPVRPCPSAQRVLVYLAVHGRSRPVQRRTLAERLWAETTSGRAAASLRSTLWRLPRPHDRDLVRTTPSTIDLAPDVQVDLWAGEDQARRLSAGGDPRQASRVERPEQLEQLEQFTELTSDLLPDWSEEWLLVEQESYRQARLHALERLCTDLAAAGRYPAALAAGLAAVRCEPLRESAHRRVVEVHLAEGNPSEALRQYQAFRRLLADELGLPPSPAIRQLVQHLLGRPVDAPGPAASSARGARGVREVHGAPRSRG